MTAREHSREVVMDLTEYMENIGREIIKEMKTCKHCSSPNLVSRFPRKDEEWSLVTCGDCKAILALP
jgi:hypothetical protein